MPISRGNLSLKTEIFVFRISKAGKIFGRKATKLIKYNFPQIGKQKLSAVLLVSKFG